ncbi:DegT/DnrJ/EryC1/StrS family aminotransferase, partial [Candidatus Micrarchaeota archaeon]|nr:DegT/DnrJ/EryC1/StrS family aminotransferase [Candidatus Micrarchaeota archaeon]
MAKFIQFSPPYISQQEINSVTKVLKSGWLSHGPLTEKFEKEFAKYVKAKFAVSVNSCTSGLFLSLAAINIKPGDEVITTPLTFAATANVVHHLGAKPVFADICEDTYNIDPDKIEEKITRKTKAIIPVHYGGQPCEMNEIAKLAKENNLTIIEDAAHATGSEYEGKMIGSLGNLTCFSFYPTKPITVIEGGMITTNNKKLAERLKILGRHGISRDAWKRYGAKGSWYYEVLEAGYKFNTTDMNSALGLAQLKRLKWFEKKRKEVFDYYQKELMGLDVTTPTIRPNVKTSYHLYPILLESYDRNKFIDEMKTHGIGTSVH